MNDIDDLMTRLLARAADPDRRAETRPSVFLDRVSSLDLGGLFRAAMGLPEVGWERVVWGGLGLDDDVG